jgi:hypothetical protein
MAVHCFLRPAGSKYFGDVGVVDGKSPATVALEIDRISAYQMNAYDSGAVSERRAVAP